MEQFDFIAVGDTVTDEFIELKDVRIDTKRDEGDQGYDEICFRFGDKVEYEDAEIIYAVGNAANAAVSATRLGLRTAFVTDIGDDELGDKKIEALTKNGVDCRFVKRHQGMKSNHHYVLRKVPERTILVKHQPYPYRLPPDVSAPKWMYFSSVGEHGLPYHNDIASYIAEHPETKLAFQPGTFQINLGYEKLKAIYERSTVFFCNNEEAQKILASHTTHIPDLLDGIAALGPHIVVITDGPRGAYAYNRETSEKWFMEAYPDQGEPIDRTGAGDSFASTFTSVLAMGEGIETALRWAPINSVSVIQKVGAQAGLLTRTELERLLAEAPPTYVPQKI